MTHVHKYNPLETAVFSLQSKNRELRTLLDTFSSYLRASCAASRPISIASSAALSTHSTAASTRKSQDRNVDPLTAALRSAIDSPVNGGTSIYTRFLSDVIVEKYPEQKENVETLRLLVLEQMRLIQQCLDVHDRVVSAAMRPLHDNLVEGGYWNPQILIHMS
jgi:hypothetical protein